MPVEYKQCPAIQLITYNHEDGAKTIFNKREDLQNSSKKNCKTIEDKAIKELMIKTSQVQHPIANLSEDNNSSPASEKIKKDDFEVVVFSDENDEKNNETEDDWIINI
ncbi:uncharacterized protein CIMG_12845 [Coccidioides immitis RS]|uniref:Uncharacterized protein n=1 Tax=Coccidioides immitis (strain RS) TaxID=246410 RepID=J3KHM3_COCIM|nr:uncharacterized protein CIMG_12845 [Coccidioides immitis RS]EAS35384.3 hypothetical protein CIMG_12845 [Coccidioides immitis RS]